MKIVPAVLCGALLALPNFARASVIDFEDLNFDHATDFPSVPDGYRGFSWNGVRVLDPAAYAGGVYFAVLGGGIVSGTNVATNPPLGMTISSGSPFDFVGAYLTSGEIFDVVIEVLGSKEGIPLYSQSYLLPVGPAGYYSFGFAGVDSLFFSAGFGGGAILGRFAMDDFTFVKPVPEPETYALVLAGLGILASVTRRKNKALTA
ncbi:MAG: PEP-CTERM sorting domain-containing protein [Rhodoferax sp.]|uniref:PEP-CTERM sorting domain-containing protein n=1 Tax=Rhodoferax sp. TaxID=50421 RepID=UPI002728F534|nr:PEP-CTERM sorting domain-containing protein [Rhodoferax sp.]MDO8450740.1 PEP-CTERM sorting domain-containing protein [Rhodoferax sp.]